METTKMSSKLLSWVWFGIAIIALLLFMYYQSQRNKDTSNLADETASSTDQAALGDTGDTTTANVSSAVSDITPTAASGSVVPSGPKQEKNVGYVSSIYDASGKTWIGIDFASVFLGANAHVENSNTQILTFAVSPAAKITVGGEMMMTADFMARFNETDALQTTLFRFTLGKDSTVYAIEELKLQ